MNLLVAVMCGLVAGGGLLLAALGLHGTVPTIRSPAGPAGPDPARPFGGAHPFNGQSSANPSSLLAAANLERVRVRLAFALLGGVAMWLLTGWPVGILLAVLVGASAPTLVGAKGRRRAVIERTEAIAGWAEQLRDTIAAAAGLQEAVAVTARVAPAPIRPAVAELAAGMRRNSLATELHRFADRLADPIADQVATALLLAAERRGDDLTRLLDDLADGARADATMRIRTETSRAQTYNDAKVVTLVVVAMFGFMMVVNRSYLDAFDTWGGQAVLAVIGVLWLAALYGITALSQVARPPRLLTVDHRTVDHRTVDHRTVDPTNGGFG